MADGVINPTFAEEVIKANGRRIGRRWAGSEVLPVRCSSNGLDASCWSSWSPRLLNDLLLFRPFARRGPRSVPGSPAEISHRQSGVHSRALAGRPRLTKHERTRPSTGRAGGAHGRYAGKFNEAVGVGAELKIARKSKREQRRD